MLRHLRAGGANFAYAFRTLTPTAWLIVACLTGCSGCVAMFIRGLHHG